MRENKEPRAGRTQGKGRDDRQISDTSNIPDAAPEIKFKSIDQIRDAWCKLRAQERSGFSDWRSIAKARTELLEQLAPCDRLDAMDALNREGGL